MNTRTILEASRRKLAELDWIQGSYQKALGKDVHFSTEYALVDGREIPITKTEAVCAIGALEVALSNKLDLGELDANSWQTTEEYRKARALLTKALGSSTKNFDTLDEVTKSYFREDYEYYLSDMREFSSGREPAGFSEWAEERLRDEIEDDSVEGWNDAPGRTKAEVLGLFDDAIELARAEELQLAAV